MLPLPTKYAKQLEQQVRRFLFHGKIAMGKLRLDELAHPVMGLVDVRRKCEALFYHLPNYTLQNGPRCLQMPPLYHRNMMEKLVETSQSSTMLSSAF